RRRSSEDVNYTEPGKLQSSRENGKNKANLSCQCAEREFCSATGNKICRPSEKARAFQGCYNTRLCDF
ncbi:hypothetical protein ACLD9W_12205, partial [Neisseria sp. WLZKY-1]|uniref:hypothetical protein n=1 Tax=Neisseria sp. WLZKY-1 TaxID=3390377 RepID=UPI003978D904